MSAPLGAAVLAGLAAGGVALLALALLGAMARVPARPVRAAAQVLLAAMAVGALAYLAAGAPAVRLAVGFRIAGVAPVLALDGLAGFFLLALMPVALAWLLVATALPWVLATVGAALLTLLAADAAFLAMAVAVAGLSVMPARGRAAAWAVALAVPALAVALALPAGEGQFTAIRAHPAEATVAALMLALMLATGGVLAVLLPGNGRAGRSEAGLAGPVLATSGLYVLARFMLDLAGLQEAHWAAPLVLGGAGCVVLGGMAAVRAEAFRGVLAGVTLVRSGLVALGLGMALAGRAVDDGPAAALALGAALVLAAVLGWAQALGALVAQGLATGAGSDALGRLGGLVHRMRFTAIGALAAALALALLPPGGGFAGLWLMLRAAVTLPRGGGFAWWAMAVLVALALGLAAALLGFAMLRVLGIAFLGRPRSPRAAAADEVAPALRWAMLGFATLLGLVGLLPGLLLLLAAPAVVPLAGAAPPGGMLGVMGYAPLGLALLLVLAGVAVALAVRMLSPAGQRVAPVWDGGAPPPPAWLPFGDPATQVGAHGFAAPLPQIAVPRWRVPDRWPRLGAALARRLTALPSRAGPALVGLLLLAMLALHGAGLW